MAHVLECPRCGGPLPARARRVVVVCAYCGATISLDGEIVRAADFRRARLADVADRFSGRTLVELAGEPYGLRGLLARGASSDVFWAERARRTGERAIVKVLRDPADTDLFEHEWEVLSQLRVSHARGTAHFSTLIPSPIGQAVLSGPAPRAAHLFRMASGFVPTLADVAAQYGNTLDPRHAVWMWRRMLEVLSWVHQSGFVHGAILPEHVVLHPRDHGAMLVGWSVAERAIDAAPLRAMVASRVSFYPPLLVAGPRPLTPAVDLTMAARTIVFVLGGESRMPGALGALLRACASDESAKDDAGATASEQHSRVGAAARAVFGPPTFVPFEMRDAP